MVELLAIIGAWLRSAAQRITAVVPYFGYSRSDKRHGRREPNMASMVALLLEAARVDHIMSIDLHAAQIEGFFHTAVDTLSAVPVLSDALRSRLPADGAVVVSLDEGRIKMAGLYAQQLSAPVAVIHKQRQSGTETRALRVVGEVRDQPCVIIYDMISTGGTISRSIAALLEAGARPEIYVVATHGLLLPLHRAAPDEARDSLHCEFLHDLRSVRTELGMTFLRFAKRFHAVFSSCFEAASRNRNGNNTIDSRPYPSKVEWRKIPPFKKIRLRALAVALLSNLTTTTKRVIWWCTNHSTLQDLRMKNNIRDKVIAITGASSGIGEAIARHLATEGAKVALGARRRGHLDKIVGEIVAAGGQALAQAVDVTKRNEVEAFAEAAVQRFGRLDVFINNAGLMPLSPLAANKVEEWERMVDVNIKGVLYGIAAALPRFQAQNSGHLINISSVAGHVVFPGGAVYCGTKFAVRAITEGFRQEAGPSIRSTIICPGAVQSELLTHVTDADTAEALKPLTDTAIEADAIARAVTFAIEQPADVDVNELIVRPTAQTL